MPREQSFDCKKHFGVVRRLVKMQNLDEYRHMHVASSRFFCHKIFAFINGFWWPPIQFESSKQLGFFRTLLAISVVFAHLSLGEKFLVGGQNAVQLFYMVSGFLITYVLNNSYSDVRAFYFNRALRIFPIYWTVAIGIAFFHLIKHTGFYSIFSQLPASADMLLGLSNIFLFGQDWVMFLGVKDGTLTPVSNFFNSDVPLFRGLLISPAWSLGLELTFYVLAPFVVHHLWRMLVLFAASLLLRWYLVSIGLDSDPWSYRFFPTELALFMAGALACRYGIALYSKKYAKYATAFAVFCLITYPIWPIDDPWKSYVLIATGLVLMPWLFLYQSNSSLDKKIGELSYPIYICHIPVFFIILSFNGNPHPALVLSIVIIVSFVLAKSVGQRVEKIRSIVRNGDSLGGKRIAYSSRAVSD